jgi:hypothetical protein
MEHPPSFLEKSSITMERGEGESSMHGVTHVCSSTPSCSFSNNITASVSCMAPCMPAELYRVRSVTTSRVPLEYNPAKTNLSSCVYCIITFIHVTQW